MTLGEIIKAYRDDHDLSQRQFAEMSGLSNGYISMLEKNVNPKTGQPMAPTLVGIKKIANAMNADFSELLERLDDTLVEMAGAEELQSEAPTIRDSGRIKEFIELFEKLPEEKKAQIIQELKWLSSEQ